MIIYHSLYDVYSVCVCCSLASVPELVSQMIGYNLKTKQTTGDGVTVRKVYTYATYYV